MGILFILLIALTLYRKMPTYEYICQESGEIFDVFQSMKDEPLTELEVAGKVRKVKRKIGLGAGIIFKGQGFYETDYKKSSTTKGNSTSESKAESTSTEKKATGGGSTGDKVAAGAATA